YKYTSPDLAKSGVLQLGIRASADRFWRRHTCTTLRRTARLIGWSVMYCLLDYCLIALIMIELLDMHDKRNIWILILIMLMIMHDDIRTMICLLVLAYD
ncbi:MAG: hypothetical protein J6586_08895, partial [Snodgrassella sp.]|nr:hypothetical protein [Snodgrassella sp.]